MLIFFGEQNPSFPVSHLLAQAPIICIASFQPGSLPSASALLSPRLFLVILRQTDKDTNVITSCPLLKISVGVILSTKQELNFPAKSLVLDIFASSFLFDNVSFTSQQSHKAYVVIRLHCFLNIPWQPFSTWGLAYRFLSLKCTHHPHPFVFLGYSCFNQDPPHKSNWLLSLSWSPLGSVSHAAPLFLQC